MRIFLLGFMGSGKTTIGKELAHALNYPFYDLDQYIEQQLQKSIANIFEQDGEEQFRQYETYYLIEIINKSEQAIIASGGGTPCFNQNLQLMQSNGITVYLRAKADTIYKRIKNTAHQRPLLQHRSDNELKQWISTTIQQREAYYMQAQHVIDVEETSIPLIISLLNIQQ